MNEILTRETLFMLPGPSKVPFFGEFHGLDGFAKMRDIADATLRHEVPEINDIRVSGNLVVIQFKDRGMFCRRTCRTPAWCNGYLSSTTVA